MSLAILSLLLPLATAKLPSSCFSYSGTAALPISSAFSACYAMSSQFSSCSAVPATAFDSCFCQQKVLNDIANCESEELQCQVSENDQSDGYFSLWHKQCDKYITFSPTTPAIASASATFSSSSFTGYCSRVFYDVCSYGVSAGEACLSSYPASSQIDQFQSCACQIPLLSAASVCEYDGNKTCAAAPAALSNIQYWQGCPTKYISSFLEAQSTMTVPGAPTIPRGGGATVIAHPASNTVGGTPKATAKSSNASMKLSTSSQSLWILLAVQLVTIAMRA